MIYISLKDFIKTGLFGPVQIGIARQELARLLGPPDDYSTLSRTQRVPAIMKYGDVEFHFAPPTDKLSLIFLDHFFVPYGGTQVSLDPWIIKGGISREEYEDGLSVLGLGWRRIHSPDPDCTWLRTDTGIVAVFVDEETDASPPRGLCALWKGAA